ncbi:YegP family protein [Acinetobacter rathckeae]|uniref:YegP family protein n=1 Tax=Acinetobacter rathckeae TaxID=2605272 RepID=UPI0018A315F1|nr:YegP family protein [Acinetobacter rathckeae]MBF7686797.1 YegP family protein [Acinetobacter rathckeae]MBF7695671.1 YegP family protein [Acinetobacter rathckeae]
MSGCYEISKAKDGQFRFVLKAGNGEVILTSELYKAKASAHTGISSIQKNSGDDTKYDRLEAKNGKAYFNLKAANHQIIGTSQMYATVASRDHGIESVKKNGPTEKIKDLTVAE